MPVASRAGRGRATRFDAAECHAWRACRDADGAVEFRSVERARARKDLAQAMEAEQRVAIKARTLVLAADAERVMADEYARCRGKLLGLSRKMQAVLPHLSAADITELDGLISEAVEELARA